MKKKHIFLLALTIALILATSLNSALAYFTTYATARGGKVIELGGTHIEEGFSNWTQRVVITNDADGQPVYVRAKAFAGSQYVLQYNDDSDRWSQSESSDGYWYYDRILDPGESTTELRIHIDGVPEKAVEGDSFNVVVIYETTPVQYDDNGNPSSDWSLHQEGGEM